jgi:cellulose synthase/poly-beta-1,6-N-acetylglucosamine synthase-like glycosyltransferase
MITLIALVAFWSCVALVLYAYFGYPLVLFVCYGLVQIGRDWAFLQLREDRRCAEFPYAELPSVTLLFAAYNEEEHLAEKIENTIQLDYPAEKLQVVIVSDGSSDRTNEILSRVSDPRFEIVIRSERSGKCAALGVAVERARNSIFVLSDGSTMFAADALRKLVRHFQSPQIGAVCGALSFDGNQESNQTEGLYWKYETALRLMEARLGATLTPSGAIYAVRGSAYTPPTPDVLVDDILTLMEVRRQGYQVHYDPEAKAVDFPASSVAGEFHRRVRIGTGSFRALPELLRVPKPGFTGFAFFSHKLLRWVLPVLLLVIFVSNLFLLGSVFYRVTFGLQLLLLLWAAVGWAFRGVLVHVRFSLVGYFLVAMNVALFIGMLRGIWGREASWQRGS